MVNGGRLAVSLFAGVTVFFSLLQFFGLWSGALGWSFSRGPATALVGLSALGAVFFAWRLGGETAGASESPRVQGGWPYGLVRLTAFAAVAGTALIWAKLWQLAGRRAPYDWDGLYYHIPAIQEWVTAGRVCWLDTPPDVPFVNYPMGVEANTFFLYQMHGVDALINACNLWYWPLAVLAVVVVAWRLGASPAWSTLAGALVAGSPVLISQSVTCYTDPGFAATVLASLAAAMLVVFPVGRCGVGTIVLWGAALGLMAGAKGSGVPFALINVAVVVAALTWRERGDVKRRWRQLGVAMLVAVAVGGYWYLRNAIATGNPVHPIQVAIGHKVILPGYDHVMFSEANLPEWLAAYPAWLRMPVSWLQLDAPIHGYAPTGGLGYLWLVACVPAVVALALVLLRRRRDPLAPRFLFLVLLVAVLLGAQTSSWWSRFTVWLIGLGLPALVVLLQRAQAAARPTAVRAAVALAAMACVGLAGWEAHRTLALEQAEGLLALNEPGRPVYRSSMQAIFPGLDETPGMDRFLAAKKIGRTRWGRLGTLMGGVLSQPLGQRRIVVLPPQPGSADLAGMRAAGVAWIVWDREAEPEVPADLRAMVTEELVYNPGPGSDFLFLCIE